MDDDLKKDLIDFFDWVCQWYYTPESLARIEAMKSRVAAQQSVNTDKPLVYRNSAGVVFCKVCGTGLDVA